MLRKIRPFTLNLSGEEVIRETTRAFPSASSALKAGAEHGDADRGTRSIIAMGVEDQNVDLAFSRVDRFLATLLSVGGANPLSLDGTDSEPLASLVEIVMRRYRVMSVIPKASRADL